MTFIHTADWQLGKPFAWVADLHKRALLQQERFEAVRRLGDLARARKAAFVLVAGDLFDSPTASRATVSAACAAIGSIKLPVLAIPGNHDHGGPGGLWDQEFFLRESRELAPNLRVLTRAEPVEVPGAVILPCPLLRRHEATDPTAWLRSPEALPARTPGIPRILLAHGSILGFDSAGEDEGDSINRIDLSRLPAGTFDYAALGDWHGTRQVGPAAWYAGTPEPDRFTKGGGHDPGNILAVEIAPDSSLQVERIPTGGIRWHTLAHRFTDDAALGILDATMDGAAGGRANRDVIELRLDGILGITAATELGERLEAWRARLIELRLEDATSIAPSAEELEALTGRPDDPLISRVASRLTETARGEGETAAIARIALCELHAACTAPD